MRDVRWAVWAAGFDGEDLLTLILRGGVFVSTGLALAGIFLQEERGTGSLDFGGNLQGINVAQMLLFDLRQFRGTLDFPSLLLHLSVAALLITPFLRVLASTVYFLRVERSRCHAILSGGVAALLIYILLLG